MTSNDERTVHSHSSVDSVPIAPPSFANHLPPLSLTLFAPPVGSLPSLGHVSRTDLSPGHSWDSIRNEDKTAPARHRNGLTYSSHQESIGKGLSSPGIRSNKRHTLIATHQLVWRGQFFYLARAALSPPTSLCKKLFPAIGEWHDRLATKELSRGKPIQPTVAENAFVQVIMMFRKTFIKDLVLMMELQPCYPIWQHSIVSDPAYLSLKRDMLRIEAREYDPAHTLLQQCVPMHSRFQTPIGYKDSFLGPSYYFAPSSPRHYFFASIVILYTPRRQTNERTSKRTNER
ncbi:hypothetical protein [Absidia glauca]|uniref:Ndc10 domain-containing protein n=1 Tax=Absidia glauca TaxID=4829 RepID=A0A163JYU0_ABSGL|nr:hypothetical protein [Absidia glauca]